jgi:hypothetical protein
MDNLLSGLIGALIGGLLSAGGSFMASRAEFTRNARLEIVEKILPPLTTAVREGDWEKAEQFLSRLISKGWSAGRKSQGLIRIAANTYNDLTPKDDDTGRNRVPPSPLPPDDQVLVNQLDADLGSLRKQLHEAIRGLSLDQIELIDRAGI